MKQKNKSKARTCSPWGTEVSCVRSPTRRPVAPPQPCARTARPRGLHFTSQRRVVRDGIVHWPSAAPPRRPGGVQASPPGRFSALSPPRAVGDMKGKFGDKAVLSVQGRELSQIKYLLLKFEQGRAQTRDPSGSHAACFLFQLGR